MARQNYFLNTSQKQMEVFSSFGGGMVTQSHPEKLRDNQSVLIENADIIQGDVLQARGAYSLVNHCDVITFNTMDDFADEELTMDDLKAYTMDDLKNNGLTRANNSSGLYFNTMEQLKLNKIKFNELKKYTMNDLRDKGVIKPNTGDSQGMFRYYTQDGYQDILAIDGKLYTIQDDVTYKKLPIKGLRNFQTIKPIEAVQYRDKMYIATGSGLVVYDGTYASTITAYVPNGLEALYIGTNGYAVDPLNYMQDTIAVGVGILGVIPDARYGVVNTPVTFTAYNQAPSGSNLEYMFEYTTVSNNVYTTGQNWSTSKIWTKAFSTADDYMIRVSIRNVGDTTALAQYVVPKYTVGSTYSTKVEEDVNYDNLASCNRIFVHYDRLFLYGDDVYSDYLYVSHLDNFTYFPRTNVLKITDPLRGSLQSVIRYKNFLLCWTNGSIQMVTGSSPTDYSIQPVHTTLGTIFPSSLQILKNYVVFVGNDNGIYVLKSFNYSSDDKLNVERIDDPVRDTITGLLGTSTRVLSTLTNAQYFLYIENDAQNYIYRFYYDYEVWVRDSISLAFSKLQTLNNIVVATDANNGIVYNLKPNVFLDGTNTRYTMKVTSKDYNFNYPHHRKKLKQYQLITNLSSKSTINANVYVDNNLIATAPLTFDPNQNTDAQKLSLMVSGRFRYVKTDISVVVKEAVQLIGFGFVFKYNTPK